MNPFSIDSWFGSNINIKDTTREIWVAGKRNTLGVGGKRRGALLGETRSGGTRGSHPGQRS